MPYDLLNIFYEANIIFILIPGKAYTNTHTHLYLICRPVLLRNIDTNGIKMANQAPTFISPDTINPL